MSASEGKMSGSESILEPIPSKSNPIAISFLPFLLQVFSITTMIIIHPYNTNRSLSMTASGSYLLFMLTDGPMTVIGGAGYLFSPFATVETHALVKLFHHDGWLWGRKEGSELKCKVYILHYYCYLICDPKLSIIVINDCYRQSCVVS